VADVARGWGFLRWIRRGAAEFPEQHASRVRVALMGGVSLGRLW
jgi:hypothetical protein